jgi:hypothetical protein
MEADKTVSTEIEVSMITTGFQTQVVPMPVCRYEILDSASGGNPVAFAIIGQAVFHKWTCDTDTVDTFCMTVHSCTVDDGAGDNLQLLNEEGCAIDRYLMGNLDYPADLMASKEVHVFKYADRPALFFNCQISIAVKEPNAQCVRPTCAEPGGQGDGTGAAAQRFKREAENLVGIVDVSTPELQTLDIEDKAYNNQQLHNLLPSLSPIMISSPQEGVCLSHTTFTLVMILGAGLMIMAVATSAVLMVKRSSKA